MGLFFLMGSLSQANILYWRSTLPVGQTTASVILTVFLGSLLWLFGLLRVREGLIACRGRLVLSRDRITYSSLITSRSVRVEEVEWAGLRWIAGFRLEAESSHLTIRFGDYDVGQRRAIVGWLKAHLPQELDVDWSALNHLLLDTRTAGWKEVWVAFRQGIRHMPGRRTGEKQPPEPPTEQPPPQA
jgi:hypothetical protein